MSCRDYVISGWFSTAVNGFRWLSMVFDSCQWFLTAVDGFRRLSMVFDGCRQFSTVLCKQATLAPTNNECFPLGLQGRYWAQNVHWPLQISCVNGHIN